MHDKLFATEVFYHHVMGRVRPTFYTYEKGSMLAVPIDPVPDDHQSQLDGSEADQSNQPAPSSSQAPTAFNPDGSLSRRRRRRSVSR